MQDEKERYTLLFWKRHHCLEQEFMDLQTAFKDLWWYSFEVAARSWQEPWPKTVLSSDVGLITRKNCRRAYAYIGPIANAPHIPPAILYEELQSVKQELARLEQCRMDAYDYAPGGCKYRELMRTSESKRLYESWQQKSDESVGF